MWLGDRVASRNRRRVDGVVTVESPSVADARLWYCVETLWSVLVTLGYAITAPIRLVFRTIAWVGRLTAVLLGFCLMVVGAALGAGPLFFVGIPLFLIGLVLTLKCLD
jgi:hypothetical protein